MSECEIDGVRYPLATERNQVLFNIADTGEALIETWNDWHLGLGATDHIPGMYYFSTGGDASRFGQIRAPLGYSTTAAGYIRTPHCQYFAAKGASDVTYIYRVSTQLAGGSPQTRVLKFSADLQTLHSTTLLGGGAADAPGRPAFWGGNWYVPLGGLVKGTGDVYRLDAIAVGAAADTWTAMTWRATSLSTFTSGGTAKIARSYDSNKVALATAAPLSTSDPGDWGGATSVGDTSTVITDMVENQGLLFVAKEDNLYEFDSDSIARPVLPFGYRVGVDAENGLGMLAFADIIFYPSIGALWRYRVGQAARPVSIDTIGTFSDVSGVFPDVRMRHRGLTNIGEWIWMVYSETATHLIAARLRRSDDPPGHEFVWHVPAQQASFASKAIFATPEHRLIIQQAVTDNAGSDSFLPLGADGSPSSFTGTRGTGGEFIMGETNFGRPQKRKQVRSAYLDLDSIGNAVEAQCRMDGGSAVSLGSLSASGVVNHTPGTDDKCFRYRPNLQFDANGGIVRSLTVEARTPSIYRVVIQADDERLTGYGLTSEDTRSNLMKLVNKGLVSVIGPAGVRDMTLVAAVPTAWQGYVEKMTEVVYQTDSGVGRGIELLIARYTTDGN